MNWRGFLRSQFQSSPSRSTRRLAARRRSAAQNFEQLERRAMLAGDVTATLLGQTAFLTGDSAANDIQVTVQDGNVVVAGLNDTTINGSSEAFVLAQNSTEFSGSIVARLVGGDDQFEISEVTVNGRLNVDGGTGNDTLLVSNGATVGGNLTLKGGSGNNSLAVSDANIGGHAWLVGGNGNDLMTVADSTIGGSIIGLGRRGNDDVVVSNTTIGRDVWISLAAGDDDVAVTDSTITRRFVVHGGQGSDVVFAEDSSVGRASRFVLGNDQDRVSIQGASDFAGRTVVAGGRKSDVIEVATTATVSRLRAFSISGGTVEAATIDERITGANGAITAAAALAQTASNLQLSLSNGIVSEDAGNGASVLTISRDSDTTEALDVTIQSSLTARLQVADSVVTIPAGSTSVSVDLDVIDDTTANGQSIVTLTASATDFQDQTTTIIVNDDESSTLSLTAASNRVTEDSATGAETVQVTARRSGDTSAAETIDLSFLLSDGSDATSILNGPTAIEFLAGVDEFTFTATTVPNTTAADDASVVITASNGTATAETTIVVEDNDQDRLTVRIDTLSVVEDGPPATVTVTRTSDTTNALNVTLESSDVARLAFNNSSIIALVIPAGATSVTQQVSAVDNDVVEGNLSVSLTATATGLNDGIATVEVVDNDVLELDLQLTSASTISEDAGVDAATFTLSRNSADVSAALQVTLAQTGDVRISNPGTVTIPAGEASVDFNVDAIDDNQVNVPATGTATFTASAANFADASAALTVTDDDVASTTFDPTSIVASEDQGTAQITLQRTLSVGAETVALTYSNDALVSGPASVEFADGESTLTFNATIIDNDSFDNNPTATITGNIAGQPEIVLNVDVANDDLLTVTTNLAANQIEQTVGGLVTRDATFTVTGQTEAGATVAIDVDNDGLFDDGTTTADATGAYTVDVTLTHSDANNGANQIQAQATLASVSSPAVSDSTNVHLAVGTLLRFATNQDLNADGVNEFYDIELLDADAPNTVDNFLEYVNDGSYENNIIHRSPPGFVIQGGGFRVDNQVVSAIPTRAPILDEFISENSNLAGTLSVAHAGPNTGTSQWFVNIADNTNLDSVPHTVFGRVIGDGLQVVNLFNSVSVADLSLITGQAALQQTPLVNSPFTVLSGAVSTSVDSATLTGTGTAFTSELQVGDVITLSLTNPQPVRVVSIQSDTELTVDLESSQNQSGLGVALQSLPSDDDYLLFENIGEILDII
ncbi:MAG: peptidylprolyl isomerase [Fuerstiella sp.]